MRVIYVDTLFFLNLAVDYLLLLLTARIGGVYVSRRRLLAAAAAGALMAVLLFFPPLPWWLSLLMCAGTGAVTALTAFGGQPRERWPRLCGIFFLMTCLLAGIVLALSQMNGRISLQNGSIYCEISGSVMLVSFTSVFVLSGLVFGNGRAKTGRICREIRIEQGDLKAHFCAFCDSGNLLRDPVNGRQVIVTEAVALAPLLQLTVPEVRSLLQTEDRETMLFTLRAKIKTPVWLLPVRTVESGGLMPVFLPEKLWVEEKLQDGYLIGMTAEKLQIGGDCSALMGV